MRHIDYIAIHCTATPQTAKIENIKKYWKEVMGWNAPGYHFIVEANGNVVELLPVDKVSNGVGGWNHSIVNVAYIGGIDGEGKAIDNRTGEQKKAMKNLLVKLKIMYPHAKIQGHRDFPNVKKACPAFNATREYEFL